MKAKPLKEISPNIRNIPTPEPLKKLFPKISCDYVTRRRPKKFTQNLLDVSACENLAPVSENTNIRNENPLAEISNDWSLTNLDIGLKSKTPSTSRILTRRRSTRSVAAVSEAASFEVKDSSSIIFKSRRPVQSKKAALSSPNVVELLNGSPFEPSFHEELGDISSFRVSTPKAATSTTVASNGVLKGAGPMTSTPVAATQYRKVMIAILR